jgi:hypothetical protein
VSKVIGFASRFARIAVATGAGPNVSVPASDGGSIAPRCLAIA